jgi:hypothetical protein
MSPREEKKGQSGPVKGVTQDHQKDVICQGLWVIIIEVGKALLMTLKSFGSPLSSSIIEEAGKYPTCPSAQPSEPTNLDLDFSA